MRFSRLQGLFIGCFWLAAAWAEVPVPPLKSLVTDLTGALSSGQRNTLEAELRDLEKRSGSQLAVLLVPTTQPEAVEQFSLRVAETWKLGQKGKDNGLLLLIARDSREVRIEVGYGLEGIIPDAISRRVIAETITPLLKQGDLSGGIKAGVQRLADLIEGKKAVKTPAISGQLKIPNPMSHSGEVIDETGTLSTDQRHASINILDEYAQTEPFFVLVVSSTRPESIAQYAARAVKTWNEELNLDVGLLMVLAKDDGTAYIEAGGELHKQMTPEAAAMLATDSKKLVTENVEPLLRKGKLVGAIQSGVLGIETIVENIPMSEETFTSANADDRALQILLVLVVWAAMGEGLRWFLSPLLGGLVMAGLTGGGVWFMESDALITVIAGLLTFILVLLGGARWVPIAFIYAGLASSGGGGASGGGGRFGGGGASGRW